MKSRHFFFGLAITGIISILFFSSSCVTSVGIPPAYAQFGPQNNNTTQYYIYFKNIHGFIPPEESLNTAIIKGSHSPTDQVHFLIQFYDLPTPNDVTLLASKGTKLTAYITGNTYIASSLVSNLDNLLTGVPNIRWLGPFYPESKISFSLQAKSLTYIPNWAVINKTVVALTIILNKDSDMTTAVNEIKSLNGTIETTVNSIPSVTAFFNFYPNLATDISEKEFVQSVDVVEPPLKTQNDKARAVANVEPVNNILGLKGDGVTVMLYDGYWVDVNHPDFQDSLGNSRVFYDDSETSWDHRGPHSTHVAGTLAGNGHNSNLVSPPVGVPSGTKDQWAGMAPHAKIVDWIWTPDGTHKFFGDYNDLSDFDWDFQHAFPAAIVHGLHIDLTSMSISTDVDPLAPAFLVPNPINPIFPAIYGYLGDYSPSAIQVDNLVTRNTSPLILAEAVGNWREHTPPLTDSPFGFWSIEPPATAKDSIAVGSINTKNYKVTETTGFGPTGYPLSFGRIKPDIVAPGCHLSPDDKIVSTVPAVHGIYGYDIMCGTSMATPVVSGAIALLVQQWHMLYPAEQLLPSTAKAILIHTATDLGKKGPDYKYGWGALNAEAAVGLAADRGKQSVPFIKQSDSVVTGQTKPYVFAPHGNHDIKATLVWDDPSGTTLTTRDLNNDLDLVLEAPDHTIYKPFVLNPQLPDLAAETGPNPDQLNNVEMAIGKSQHGVWHAFVRGASITMPPSNGIVPTSQGYTLIVSSMRNTHMDVTSSLVHINFGMSSTVTANVTDVDIDTPIVPAYGTINFTDGNMGGFSDPICEQKHSSLICTATYTPTHMGTNTVTATFSGDGVHSESSGSTPVSYCLIATAAFGSELSPEVQTLRDFRDNQLLSTKVGSDFMNVFNNWYYSFSPYVADYELQNPLFKEIVKGSIYPLVGILLVSEKASSLAEGNYGTMIAGIVTVSMIGAVYVSPLTLSIGRVRNGKLDLKFAALALLGFLAFSLGAILSGNQTAIMLSSLLFLLSIIAFTALFTAKTFVKAAKKLGKLLNQTR